MMLLPSHVSLSCYLFFFNDTAPTEIYTLSLHDALPISRPGGRPTSPGRRRVDLGRHRRRRHRQGARLLRGRHDARALPRDRKSTRLNSSHSSISYAVFCLKKKKKKTSLQRQNANIIKHI